VVGGVRMVSTLSRRANIIKGRGITSYREIKRAYTVVGSFTF
jgi:hypothetical protein